ANRREADRGRIALAGDAVALEHSDLIEIAPQRIGDHLAHSQGGAGGGIDLVAMVRLDDLDVVAAREDAGGDLEQFERGIDADAHVGSEHDRYALRGGIDPGPPGL